MLQLPGHDGYQASSDRDGDLLSFAAFVTAVGAGSSWPIDADGRAVAVIVIVIAVVARRFRTGKRLPVQAVR